MTGARFAGGNSRSLQFYAGLLGKKTIMISVSTKKTKSSSPSRVASWEHDDEYNTSRILSSLICFYAICVNPSQVWESCVLRRIFGFADAWKQQGNHREPCERASERGEKSWLAGDVNVIIIIYRKKTQHQMERKSDAHSWRLLQSSAERSVSQALRGMQQFMIELESWVWVFDEDQFTNPEVKRLACGKLDECHEDLLLLTRSANYHFETEWYLNVFCDITEHFSAPIDF